ncbi:MAG: TolC family protein [Pirellulaceae bacterium]|nr:TolC family protein [Pirellulaceae bacterium]
MANKDGIRHWSVAGPITALVTCLFCISVIEYLHSSSFPSSLFAQDLQSSPLAKPLSSQHRNTAQQATQPVTILQTPQRILHKNRPLSQEPPALHTNQIRPNQTAGSLAFRYNDPLAGFPAVPGSQKGKNLTRLAPRTGAHNAEVIRFSSWNSSRNPATQTILPENSSSLSFTTGLETLESIWQQALNTSYQTQASLANIHAKEHLLGSVEAQWSPTVRFDAAYSLQDRERAYNFVLGGVTTTDQTFRREQREGISARVRAELPLTTGGRRSHLLAATEADWEIAQLEHDRQKNQLQLTIAQDYLQVLWAQHNLQVATNREKFLQRLFDHVCEKEKQGLVPVQEKLQTKLELTEAVHQTKVAFDQLDLTKAALNLHLNRPLDSPLYLQELSPKPLEQTLPQITQAALENDLLFKKQVAAEEKLAHEGQAVLSRNRPQSQIYGQYDFAENRYEHDEGIASLGIGLQWNLYDGGRANHRANALASQANALHFQRQERQARLELNARKVYFEARQAEENIVVLRENMNQATTHLRNMEKQLEAGLVTSQAFLNAEAFYTETAQKFYTAHYRSVLANLHILHLTGKLTSENIQAETPTSSLGPTETLNVNSPERLTRVLWPPLSFH